MQFFPNQISREKWEELVSRPAPQREYCIYFTPRSGSSWLTELATQTRVLGSPREAFNPNFCETMAKAMNAATMEEYVAAMRRQLAHRRTFGLEITLYQLRKVFGQADGFMQHFGAAVPIFLIREDIVLQGVSLCKMVETGVAHSVSADGAARVEAEAGFGYDADAIESWITHIRNLETLSERHFDRYALEPLRISYEGMMAAGPEAVVDMLRRVLGVPHEPVAIQSRHEKIGTGQNIDYAARFRAERPDFCAALEAERRDRLAALVRDFGAVG